MLTTASPTFCTTRTIGVMRMSSGGKVAGAVGGLVPLDRAVASREHPTSITATGNAVRHRSMPGHLIVGILIRIARGARRNSRAAAPDGAYILRAAGQC